MKKSLYLLIAILILGACAKEKDTKITANLTWQDDTNITDRSDANWIAALYEDATYLGTTAIDKEPVEYKAIQLNDASVSFTYSLKKYTNFSVIVFYDTNKNGKYDASEYYKPWTSGTDPGEDLTMSIDNIRY